MNHVEKTIEIERTADAVFAHWERVREWPAFMEGVAAVESAAGEGVAAVESAAGEGVAAVESAAAGGRFVVVDPDGGRREYEVVEVTPGELFDCRAVDGGDRSRFTLIALSPRRTRVDLAVDREPHGLVDRASDALGALERRVEADLECFRAHVQAHTDSPA